MSKRKIKIVYRNRPEVKEVKADLEKKAREEIAQLEEAKRKNIESTQGKGFFERARFALGRGALNKEINQRRQFLSGQQAIRNINTRVEVEKAKGSLRELQTKNIVTFESLQGMPSNSHAKSVKFEDIFK